MKATSNFVSVRSSKSVKGKKKLYVRGYASTKGLYDTYKWMKNDDGTNKTFKSLFTDACIDDMKKQAMSKTIFVDALHTIATDEGIIKMLEEKGASKEEIGDAKGMLKQKKLPLAKPVEFDVDDQGFVFASETNPYFAEVDTEHEKYYDAMCNSIEDGYLKAYSINFDPVDYVTEVDDKGNEWTRFDKINLYGISYTDQPALETNSFAEVAIRSMIEVRNERKGDNTMEEKKEEVVEKKEEVAPVVEAPKKDVKDVDAEVDRRVKEELTKKEVSSQLEEQKKTIEELNKRMDELRKTNDEGSPKSVVRTDREPATGDGAENPEEWVKDKLKKITEKHNNYMDYIRKGGDPNLVPHNAQMMGGMGELVALQAEMMSHTVKMPGESDEAYNTRMSLTSRESSDDMIIQRRRNE